MDIDHHVMLILVLYSITNRMKNILEGLKSVSLYDVMNTSVDITGDNELLQFFEVFHLTVAQLLGKCWFGVSEMFGYTSLCAQ